jgi:hypothetical protein
MNSICIFHNGNSRILEIYKNKFNFLEFAGNLACVELSDNKLYEICYADASDEILFLAKENGIKIIRHISTFEDDILYGLLEFEKFFYDQWIKNVIIPYLSYADDIITDFKMETDNSNEVAIITTGRSASTHLEEYLKSKEIISFEYRKVVDYRWINSKSAILLWREDQWECLASTWISLKNDFQHNIVGEKPPIIDKKSPEINTIYVDKNWKNMSRAVLDHSLFYYYVLKKPISYVTTEYCINFQTRHKKIQYNKHELILNYDMCKEYYFNSLTRKILNLLYQNTIKHLS